MNAFISIVCDAFAELREELLDQPNDFEFIEYFKNRLKSYLSKLKNKSKTKNKKERFINTDDNIYSILNSKTTSLLDILNIVSNIFQINW